MTILKLTKTYEGGGRQMEEQLQGNKLFLVKQITSPII